MEAARADLIAWTDKAREHVLGLPSGPGPDRLRDALRLRGRAYRLRKLASRCNVVTIATARRKQMSLFGMRATQMVTPAGPCRAAVRPCRCRSGTEVLGTPLAPPYPAGTEIAEFALGCFWGEEQKFLADPGRRVAPPSATRAATRRTPPTRRSARGRTGHAETVRVVFDPAQVDYAALLKVFWESHDPTQGMRQGNDVGTQYRSVIFYRSPEQQAAAEESREAYQRKLTEAGYGEITTEIVPAGGVLLRRGLSPAVSFSNKNPNGYCPDHGTGVSCPVGVVRAGG